MLCGRYWSLKTLNGGSVDGGVVQVIPVGRSVDEEGVSQLVCAAAWDFVGPIPYLFLMQSQMVLVVTWSGCCRARMSLPGFC